jgi:hypothetical protein
LSRWHPANAWQAFAIEEADAVFTLPMLRCTEVSQQTDEMVNRGILPYFPDVRFSPNRVKKSDRKTFALVEPLRPA